MWSRNHWHKNWSYCWFCHWPICPCSLKWTIKRSGLSRCVSHTPLQIGKMWFPWQKGEWQRDELRLGVTGRGDEAEEEWKQRNPRSVISEQVIYFHYMQSDSLSISSALGSLLHIGCWAGILSTSNQTNSLLLFWLHLARTNTTGLNGQVDQECPNFLTLGPKN